VTTRALTLPTFFLAGVPKAGTTSLYAYLRQHPQIYMCWPKEPTFFGATDVLAKATASPVAAESWEKEVPEIQPHWRGSGTAESRWAVVKVQDVPGRRWVVTNWDDYLDLFRYRQDEVAIGDASVDHFWLPSAAPAIHAKVPEARLVFVLRNPADRLFAEYAKTLWSETHQQTFRKAFLEGLEGRDPWKWPRVLVGQYATHLARFAKLFPQRQICVLLYEDYRSNPQSMLREIFRFLDVDPDRPIDLSHRHNEAIVPRFTRLHGLRRRFLGDTSLLTWLPESARGALRRLYRGPRSVVSMSPADRAAVIDYYREQILGTADLIGRDLSAWLR
jgi:hypothetical protein